MDLALGPHQTISGTIYIIYFLGGILLMKPHKSGTPDFDCKIHELS